MAEQFLNRSDVVGLKEMGREAVPNAVRERILNAYAEYEETVATDDGSFLVTSWRLDW